MSFYVSDAAASASKNRLKMFRKHLVTTVFTGVLLTATTAGAIAQQQPAYYNADGTRTNDLEAAKKSWRDDAEFNGNDVLKALNADAAYAMGFTGKGTKLGIIDQPVYAAHSEFAGEGKINFIKTEGTRLYTDPYIPVKAGDHFVADDRQYIDGYREISAHGTHVAGIAGANRDGKGTMGVAFDTHIFAASNYDAGPEDGVVLGNDGAVYSAAWDAMIKSRVSIITDSWGVGLPVYNPFGLPLPSSTWTYAKAYGQYQEIEKILGTPKGGAYNGAIKAAESGIVVEFSAGNDSGLQPDALASLATFRPELEKNWLTTMSVVADEANPQGYSKSSFSSICGYSKYYCVASPGSRIKSSVPVGNITGLHPGDIIDDSKLSSGYAKFDGTSMAGPGATGAFTVLKQRFPYLSNGDVNEILKTTATDLGEAGVDDVFGWGLINLKKAVNGPSQFLGRFVADISKDDIVAGQPQGSDIWSNDISDVALRQRQKEEKAEISNWDAARNELSQQILPVPEIVTKPSAELITGVGKALDLLKAAINSNDLSHLFQPNDNLAKLKADPIGRALLAAYEVQHPNFQIGFSFSKPSDYDAFINGRTISELALNIASINRTQITDANQAINTQISAGQFRVDQLSQKTDDDYIGGLTKTGSGTLTLSGKNTYRGETVVDGGELAIGATGSIVSASVINATGLLSVDGRIGAATVNGDGRLLVNATGVMGDATVNGGGLMMVMKGGLSGDLALNGGYASIDGHSGNASVNMGGILGGNGYVGGLAVHAGGTVAPGHSIGTLHSDEEGVRLDPGSLYLAEVDGAGHSDRIETTGPAAIAGFLALSYEHSPVSLTLADVRSLLGQNYTVLTADGGITGRFDESLLPQGVFLGTSVNYGATAVTASLGRNGLSFADAGKTSNQRGAGAGVEGLGFGKAVFETLLLSPTLDQARAAETLLAGEIHADVASQALDDGRVVRGAVLDRLRDRRDDDLATWTQAIGGWGETDGNANAAGTRRQSVGFVTGADKVLDDTWLFGAAAGYSNGTLKADAVRSDADVTGYHLSAYGGVRMDDLNLRVGGSYSILDIDTTRSVAFGGIADRLHASYGGRLAQGFGEAGYRIDLNPAVVEPFAGVAFAHLDEDAFQEKGGTTALHGRALSEDRLSTTLGVRATAELQLDAATLVPRAELGWRHSFGDTTPAADLSFGKDASGFEATGAPSARDSLLVKAGIDARVTNSLALGIGYAGELANTVQDHTFNARLSVSF